MNRSLAAGLLIGLAAGLIVGALIGRAKSIHVAPPAAPPAPPPPAKLSAIEEELARFKRRVAELEAAQDRPKAPPPAPNFGDDPPEEASKPAAPGAEPTLPELMQEFAKLGKRGLEAYTDPNLKSLAQQISKAGPKAVEAVIERLANSESASERFVAAALLEQIGSPAAVEPLARAMRDDEDVLVRRMASHALAFNASPDVVPHLKQAIAGTDEWGIRVNAAFGLAVKKEDDGVRWLNGFYESASSPAESKGPVLGALAHIASPLSAPVFRKLLAEGVDVGYQLLAVGALQAMKDRDSLAQLIQVSNSTAFPANVREAAKKAAEALAK